MLAHLTFRTPGGSLTGWGWYWVVISTVVIIGSLFNVIAPQVICRMARLESMPHALSGIRLFSLVTGAGAIWFGLMALTAGPGQVV